MKTKDIGIAILVLGFCTASNSTLFSNELPASIKQVLDRHVAAAGGQTRLHAIQSEVLTYDMEEGGEHYALEISFKPGEKILLVASSPAGWKVRQGQTNAGERWRHSPNGLTDRKDPKDVLEFRELALCLSSTAIPEIEQHFPKLQLLGTEKVGSNDCQALEAKMSENLGLKLWFDLGSGLLRKVDDTVLEDYRAEEGVMVPHLVIKEKTTVLKLKSVKFNVDILDKEFEKPSKSEAAAASEEMAKAQYVTLLNPPGQTGIVRDPPAAKFDKEPLESLPVYNPNRPSPFQVDLRSADLSRLQVLDRIDDLMHADFDNKTKWPTELPARFAPQQVLKQGKNPGLGVRELHRRGITGKGIGLAIVDQTLLVEHVEYKDRLRSYEELHSPGGVPAQMHGPAVASLAVGKSVGVAPEADLYYIAEMHGTMSQGKFDWDFTWLAKAIDRVLEINDSLPKARKIRVLSISVGWSAGQKGCAEADDAVERAGKAGVFVISTAIERTHGFAFHGLARDNTKDPDVDRAYGPGSWWAKSFFNGESRFLPGQRVLVPMDNRTTASPTGPEDYVYYCNGGWSWSVPYLAGLYALACQVRGDVTPDLFWTTALKTGHVIPIEREGKTYDLGNVVDPVALINSLENRMSAAP